MTDLADALRAFVAAAERPPSEVEAVEPTPTNFTPAALEAAPAARKVGRGWLAVSALLACTALGYWHFRNSAALSVAAAPSPRHDASPKFQLPAPHVPAAAQLITVAPTITALAVSAAAAPTSVAAPHVAPGPKFYVPPTPRERAPETAPPSAPDSPEARYGL